jgi:hypothetical protein
MTSALDGGGWSTPRPGRFTPRGKDAVPICIGGWLGPQGRSGLARKISPHRDSITGPSSPFIYIMYMYNLNNFNIFSVWHTINSMYSKITSWRWIACLFETCRGCYQNKIDLVGFITEFIAIHWRCNIKDMHLLMCVALVVVHPVFYRPLTQ